VTLTADPDPGWTLGGWSGSCAGTNPVCQVTMSAIRTATSTFEASGATDFYTVSPCRVLDSRAPSGPWLGQPLHGQEERSVTVVGGACLVPATAKAVSFNVTATAATVNGNLRLYPAGTPRPLFFSTVNFTAGVNRANNGVVGVGVGGALTIFFSGGASESVHVVLDVNGYFE
jgi:hypothetical protein